MALHALPTVGVIARRLQRPIHRVNYVIDTRGIEPIGKAGHARVFTEGAVEKIAAALESIDANRGVDRD